MDSLYQKPDALKKIELIAVGILRKNYKFVRRLEVIIADAILIEPQAVQLVARSTGNNLEMEKDWEWMSEFDKDELIRQKIIHEL